MCNRLGQMNMDHKKAQRKGNILVLPTRRYSLPTVSPEQDGCCMVSKPYYTAAHFSLVSMAPTTAPAPGLKEITC